MPKGFQDARYRRLIGLLVIAREDRNLSQSDVASRLSTHQQFVSRYETGERRLDIIEYLDVCAAVGIDGLAVLRSIDG